MDGGIPCHCEAQSDEAIPFALEIATLRAQLQIQALL